MNEERILQWAEYEFKTNKEVIEDVSTKQVHGLIEENDYVLVFLCKTRITSIIDSVDPFYESKICHADSDHCDRCAADIQALEQIDDDTDAVGVKFVKTDDASFAKEIGVKELPTIVYFEKGSPSIYEGKMLYFQIMKQIFWKRSSLLLRPHSTFIFILQEIPVRRASC